MGLFDFFKKKKPDNKDREMSKENLQETQQETDTSTSGKRIYFAGWVESGESDMLSKVGEIPLSKMQISHSFGIPVGSIETIRKSDWNPPLYGKLTNAELVDVNTPKAKDFHKQLKKSLTEYLLKNGYSREEIDRNYRFVGFNGRGGILAVQAVFEMNMK